MEYGGGNGQDEMERIINLGKQKLSKFGGVVPLVVISLLILILLKRNLFNWSGRGWCCATLW